MVRKRTGETLFHFPQSPRAPINASCGDRRMTGQGDRNTRRRDLRGSIMNIEKTIIAIISIAAGAAVIVAAFGIVVCIGIGLSVGIVAGLAGIAAGLAGSSTTRPSLPTA